MTEPPFDLRTLSGEDELRAGHTLFRACLHEPPATDEDWPYVHNSFDRATSIGAVDDSGVIGTLTASDTVIALPGGKLVPMAAVSRVGVRADRTRRGVVSAIMRTFLEGTSAPIATLRATEGTIYRRFGYGVATRARSAVLDTARARLHAGAPVAGDVRLVQNQDEVRRLVPELHQRFGTVRPGGITMSDGYWQLVLRREKFTRLAVHEDGFAAFKAKELKGEHYTYAMEVVALFAATPTATATLLKFLLGMDLIRSVTLPTRPVDEDLDLLFADPRAAKYGEFEDETWLRLVDVPAALAARTYGSAEPVVIEVVDGLLPANSGRYLVGPDGAERTGRDPQLRLDVADLAAAYLGDRPLSRFAAAGLVEVFDEAALADADRLFRLDEAPWCGTYF
ncbi:GNAT family N-acetyltransferase [Kutzneria sp. CA-103260]|uniref:GNAT family N-acetyltransferase n=1 Tax=Kutzneria sp. CA-103260 TaxID=2802641 RepID=UPI001BA912DF|nr:GNAT family N-acetyltransferase [Kutzneria sp. CA-103260]QUQ65017.1 GNAT family N-acetyltransferase [Kutzneria sp. CA-103260]